MSHVNINRIMLVLISLLFLTSFVFILKFLFLDKTPPRWDDALHLKYSLFYFKNLKEFNLWQIFSIYTFYPPLTYILMAFLILFLGYSKLTILLFNFSFLTLLLFTAYQFTKTLFDKFTALNLVGILLLLCVIFHPSGILIWELMPDFPLMAIVFINYCFFYLSLKEENFTSKRSFQLGLLIAFALLIKWSSVVYLFIPVIFYLASAYKKGHLKEVLILFCPIFFLSGLWYFPHLKPLFRDLKMYSIHQGFVDQDPQWFKGIFFYLKNFLLTVGPLVLIIPFSLALFLVNFFKKNKKVVQKVKYLDIFDWVFLGFPTVLFGFFIPNKDPRYLYPIFILFIAVCFWRIRRYFDLNKIWFITPSILLITILSLPKLSPKPSNDSLINHLGQIVLKNKPQTIAYFFESDSPSFNYANVSLFHQELNYFRRNDSSYFYLNQMNTEDEKLIRACHYFTTPQAIVIFKRGKTLSPDYKWQASFEEDCPGELRKNYEIKERINISGEEIIYLAKKAD